MHRNSSMLVAALAATGLLTLPAGALAAGTVIAGPVKAKGYTMTVTATDAGAADSFSVMAVKAGGGSQQMHSWSFKGVNVSVKGAKATIKGDLGSYGKVNAKLTAGAKVKGAVPAGCTGTPGSARRGTLKGATKLVLDSTFFRTLAPNSLKGQIVQGAKLDCSGGATGGPTTGLVLTSFADGSDGQLMLNVLKQGSKVVQQVMRTDAPGGNASVFHLILANTGASGLQAAGDHSTATVTGAGPFLGGALSFSGEPMGSVASGTVSGDLVAKFDSIGSQSLPAGNDAMLMQR